MFFKIASDYMFGIRSVQPVKQIIRKRQDDPRGIVCFHFSMYEGRGIRQMAFRLIQRTCLAKTVLIILLLVTNQRVICHERYGQQIF